MGFDDTYRMSSHAVITDDQRRVLMLKATYGSLGWGFPGGALDPGETVLDALHRECMEEIGCRIRICYLSGIYHHRAQNSHVLIFRCEFLEDMPITLSEEHSEWKYLPLEALSETQRRRVEDCLSFTGEVRSGIF